MELLLLSEPCPVFLQVRQDGHGPRWGAPAGSSLPGGAVRVPHPAQGCTPRRAHPVSQNPSSDKGKPKPRHALAGLLAGDKVGKARVVLANDLIRAKPFAGGSTTVQRGFPWDCALSRVRAYPRGGLWPGWRSSASPGNGLLHPTSQLSLGDLLPRDKVSEWVSVRTSSFQKY